MTVEPQFVYGRPNPRYTGPGVAETPAEETWEQRGEAAWRANEWKPDSDVDTGAHFLQGGLGLPAKAALVSEEQAKPVEKLKDERTGSPIYRIGESEARISRRGPHDKVLSTMTVPEADQGKGNGTKLLQAVTRDADRAKDTLHLEAHAYQNRRLSSNQLRSWYARHGFRPNTERGGDWMIRHPVVRDPEHQATYAVNPDDRRLRQGQTPSNFVHPETGHNMGKSEIGDTFEQLFRAKGAHLLEEKFGGPYQEVTHVEGGPRNTPLDFRLDHLFGGELKTLNVNAKSQKTAIKREEIERKYRAIAGTGMSPLMVVQVVDMANREVHVYSFPDFASKRVTSLDHLGSYTFTPEDFREAQQASGHYEKRHGRAVAQAIQASTEPPSQPTIAPELRRSVTFTDRTGVPLAKQPGPEQKLGKLEQLTPKAQQLLQDHGVQIFVPQGQYAGDSAARLGFRSELKNTPGVYSPTNKRLLIPRIQLNGDTALHEASHAVDHALGRPSDSPRWTELNDRISRAVPDSKMGPHFRSGQGTRTARERFAELMMQYQLGKPLKLGPTAGKLPRSLSDDVSAFFHELIGSPKVRTKVQPTIDKEGHAELLKKRTEMRKLYPPGHPERLKAERAVRQSRKEFREGEGGGEASPKPAVQSVNRPAKEKSNTRVPVAKLPGGSTLGFVSPMNSEMRQQVTQLLTEAINRQEALLPGSTKGINFVIDNPQKLFGRSKRGSTVFGATTRGTHVITLHPNIFTTDKSYANQLNDRNWWSGADQAFGFHDQVIAHELGHETANRLGQDSFPTNPSFWNAVSSMLGTAPPNFPPYPAYGELEQSIESWFARNRSKVQQLVSEYATSSVHELLAELWSEYAMKEFPRLPAQRYGEYIGGTKKLKKAGVA